MNLYGLDVPYDGPVNWVTVHFYIITFGIICSYFTFKSRKVEITDQHLILIGLILMKTITYTVSGVVQIYGYSDCTVYIFTRFAYFSSFLLITYTFYHFIKVFCETETKIMDIRITKYMFIVVDFVVFVIIMAIFGALASQNTKCKAQGNILKELNTWCVTLFNFLLGIFCLVFSLYLIHQYRKAVNHMLSIQSKRAFTYVIVCAICLMIEQIIRVAFHLYKPITGRYMDDVLYRTGTYYLPDLIEYVAVIIMWHLDEMMEGVGKHDEQELIDYSIIMTRNIVSRFYEENEKKMKASTSKNSESSSMNNGESSSTNVDPAELLINAEEEDEESEENSVIPSNLDDIPNIL